MGKTLVIIESSGSKMKKMSKLLGPKYIVAASKGHIKRLKSKSDGVEVNDKGDYKLQYELIKEKMKNTVTLKRLAADADQVIIATDRDREGEAIGYHICKYLGLDVKTTPRLIFNAIDKKSVMGALAHPAVLDMNVVHEQMARAATDYLIGFGVSPVVSRKLKKGGLSAGRVQSVVLRMVMDKEREIEMFDKPNYFVVDGEFLYEKELVLDAKLDRKYETYDNVLKLLDHCSLKETVFTLGKLKSTKRKVKPPAPFVTSSMIQEAGKRFGLDSKRTMKAAQRLYEEGVITYMRTDCAFIAEPFQELIGEFVDERFGSEYVDLKQYQTTDATAQEAHECIRPTDLGLEELVGDDRFEPIEWKLYKLIWQRCIASQMSRREMRTIVVPIFVSEREERFEAKAEEELFDGYMAIYRIGDAKKESSESAEGDENATKGVELLKGLKEGVIVEYAEIKGEEKRVRVPSRYDDVGIVKKMESMGIGRPSTYHTLVPKLLDRGYAVFDTRVVQEKGKGKCACLSRENGGKVIETEIIFKEESDKKRLFPTDIGASVESFLGNEFDDLFNYKYTAEMEKMLDMVAEGKKGWQRLVGENHHMFKERVERFMGELEAVKREDNRRFLGELDGEQVYAYVARYGPVVLIGKRFLPLKSSKLVESITLEQVKAMPKFPITLGEHEGEQVMLKDGRYGMYLVWNGGNYNLPKELAVNDINMELAVSIIQEKDKKVIKSFGPKLKIMNGPYGPYINHDGVFVSVPEGEDPESLDEETCRALVKALGKKKGVAKKKSAGGGGGTRKKRASKKK